MAVPNVKPGETYTIRRKLFQLAGASFEVFGPDEGLVAFCHQKAFKLREDIRLYSDREKTEELFSLKARSIMDFSTTYDMVLPSGESLGSLRRKGMASSFLRDSWLVFGPGGEEIATIKEKSAWLAFARRAHELVASFSPQTFEVRRAGDGDLLATYRQHFNPLVFRMGVAVHGEDPSIDELLLLGAACLIAAIEGRQG